MDDLGTGWRFGARVAEALERRTNRTIIRRDDHDLLVQEAVDAQVLRRNAEVANYTLVGGQGVEPQEVPPQRRREMAARSLTAFLTDPHAGSIVDHYLSFVFGRGVPVPRARDTEVQARFDEAWAHPANQLVLTSPEALAEKGRDFVVQANVHFLYFVDGDDGLPVMSLANFATIDHPVRNSENRLRIQHYAAQEQRRRYVVKDHSYEMVGSPKWVYYQTVQEAMHGDAFGVEQIPEGMVAPGLMLHLATNKTSEMAFGVPSFRRITRWMTAYNEVLTSFTERMKAAAKLYMKGTVKGGQKAVERAARNQIGRPNSLAGDAGIPTAGGGPRHLATVLQNEGMDYEPFKIDTGATDMAAAAPQMLGMISAGGQWPQAYMTGVPGELAGSATLELPTLKFVEREQELWARPFRTLADLTISRSIETGHLSERRPATPDDEPLIASGKLTLAADGTVERDLSYDFALPSPLQRQMGDFVTAAVQVASAVDPNGEFPELSRWLFGICLAEAFDEPNAQEIVDRILPAGGPVGAPAPGAEAEEGAEGANGDRHTEDRPYGEQRTAAAATPEQVRESETQGPVRGEARLAGERSRRRRSDAVRGSERGSRAWAAFGSDALAVAGAIDDGPAGPGGGS